MVFSNKEGAKRLRLYLLIISVVWLLGLSALLFLEMFTILGILAGLFVITAVLIAILNFQYVRIAIEKNKLIVKYYSIFSIDREFQVIEFPNDLLRKVAVNKYFLGLKYDVRLTVRVPKGLAEYPPVSFSAIPFRKRSKLVMELQELIPQKNQLL